MNQRIKELAKQATRYIDPTINEGVCWELDQEKFAQLIVQECVDQVELFNVWPDVRPRHIVEAIKQHFGVEE